VAEMKNSSVRAAREEVKPREAEATLALVLKYFKNSRSPMDHAWQWAERTLKARKLPTRPGLYTLASKGCLSLMPSPKIAGIPADVYRPWHPIDPDIECPWQLPLHDALLRIGFKREDREYIAAKLLSFLWNMRFYVENGDSAQAASAAFMAGALWSERDFRMAQAVRRGGRSESEEKSHNVQHERWRRRSAELKRQGFSQRARSKIIAEEEHGEVTASGVRRVLQIFEGRPSG
jgi:hypothetical protein